MITLRSIAGLCSLSAEGVSFDVFPASAKKDSWTLLPQPEEGFKNEKMISWPGEYDFSGVSVRGIGQEQGKYVSYHCVVGGIRLAFIGNSALSWADAELEKLGDIDVLVLIPVDAKKVTALIESVDPRVVVLAKGKESDLPGTLKSLGQGSAAPVSEFKVKPGSLPQDGRQVVVLG